MCKNQTSVSHSSTESDIISLDAGLRMDGLPALDHGMWWFQCCVRQTAPKHQLTHHLETDVRQGNSSRNHESVQKQKGNRAVKHLSHVDHFPTNTHSSQSESQLYIFGDNEAVIKMIIKGRSPTMRHVWRTHRVALDWLFDRINLDSKIQI